MLKFNSWFIFSRRRRRYEVCYTIVIVLRDVGAGLITAMY